MAKKSVAAPAPPGADGFSLDGAHTTATWRIRIDGLEPNHLDPAKDVGGHSAIAHASIVGKDLRRELHGCLRAIVEKRLENMDADDYVQMHMEDEIQRRVAAALDSGWTDAEGCKQNVERVVSRMIQQEATRQIADGYQVIVNVELRKRSER